MMPETVDTLPDNAEGEDIVWTAWQHAEVRKRTGRVLRTLLNISRAMASYGICVGVLGAIRASAVPFIEVSAAEVKLGSVGKKTATKQEMIQWATNNHPEAPWPTYKEHGKDLISEAKAEHMADAIASIYAGRETNQFQQLVQFLKANHANHPQAA